MALSPGVRLGPYEILGAIGAGGMGEVYKARDTRLDRTVAIKVLPADVANDPELRARFEREARAIAALDHPHICAVYDVGDHEGTHYLVMQHLDGETLAARLERSKGRPLPLPDALKIAIEIADALDKAHRAGITHRDVTPANIFLVRRGGASAPPEAKLLDFGLAKLRGPAAPISMSGMTRLATPTPNTAHGTILGTVHYMAPEQVEGKEADARSDIWALGVVIYEMSTGQRPFNGESPASIIGAILKDAPQPVSRIRARTPPLLDPIVRRCLAKDPDERWQTAADLMRDLEWIDDSSNALPVAQVGPRSERVAWSVAGLAIVAAAALSVPAFLYLRRPSPQPLATRFDIARPLTNDPGSFALSRDGRQLAFVATADGATRLWVRPLDQVQAKPLAATDGAADPFWAPDGKAIGFFADGKLKRVDLAGGAPLVLANAPSERGGTWNSDGTIVFAPTSTGSLLRVAATGGTPVAATRLTPGQSHRWPQALGDGRRFLFFVGFGRPETRGVYVASLDGGEPTRVLETDTAGVFAPPEALLLVRQNVLIAFRFDPARGAVSGDPIPVAQNVGVDASQSRGAFTVSATGVLAHSVGGRDQRQLVWVDRTGKVQGSVGAPDPNNLANPELAPDGRRVAVNRNVQGNPDIWLIDIGRAMPTRFTADTGIDNSPLWSSDGLGIVFRTGRNGVYDLFEKPANAARDEQPLLATAEDKNPMSWSPDGRVLLYAIQHPTTGTDLWALPLSGDRKPFAVVQTPFDETGGQFSPDGRWVAYESNANQQVEVYVQPFPGPGGTFQVSTAGGSQPRWRPDGKELFYLAPDGRLMAVAIEVGVDRQTLDARAPVPLFQTQLASGRNIFIGALLTKPQYAVAPDGRFLMNVSVEPSAPSPITVVLNWAEALKR